MNEIMPSFLTHVPRMRHDIMKLDLRGKIHVFICSNDGLKYGKSKKDAKASVRYARRKVQNKMTKIYIVRHGQTDYNKAHRLQGRIDIPLNETGLEQAKTVAKSLENVDFDVIYYSPLTRAKQTADEVYKKHKNAEYIEAPEIIERNFGDYEGQFIPDDSPYFGLWDYTSEPKVIKGGESMEDMKKRIFPFLDKLLEERKDQNICLVCHGGAGLIIREYFEGAPESKNLLDFSPIPNGEAIIFER